VFEPVIGLEIHAQLATASKLFCSCPTAFGAEPNHNTCPVCLGLPGVLPTINKKAVDFAIMLGLATDCEIRLESEFARKNYFYPDLPKAYQISQYEKPICENGSVEIIVNNQKKKIGITRIHLEEDAGKLLHGDFDDSFVDLNRAGVPLVEIVSEPDLRSSEEARAYMQKIYSIVTSLGVCLGDMEKGNLRCDANISLRVKGEKEFGTRTETKNLNSFRFIKQAIEYEINRQTDLLQDGEKVSQETRLYDSVKKKTFLMRKKEESDDYRYFPCPDLPLVKLDKKWVDDLQKNLPELPDDKIKRYKENYGLGDYDASGIVFNGFAPFFEKTIVLGANCKQVVNWLMSDISKYLNEEKLQIHQTCLSPQKLVELLELIEKNIISNKIAKSILPDIIAGESTPKELVAKKNLAQISDEKTLETLCQNVISSYPAEVKKYQEGKDRVFGFFVGQVMKESQGKANPQIVKQYLQEILKK
jgi:aspartyl-tRNA(Asn)/glutamyl-tRNA(Gln) amidotransferase subunit B